MNVARLYCEYGKKIYTLAYGMSGDSALAQDVVHDVFLQVIKGLEAFGATAPWVRGFTRSRGTNA